MTNFVSWFRVVRLASSATDRFAEPDSKTLPKLDLGRVTESGENRELGDRLPRKREIHWRKITDPQMLNKMLNAEFQLLGFEEVVLDEVNDVSKLGITGPQLMALTLYTGPMFVIYNTVTRAMGVAGAKKGISPYGQFWSKHVYDQHTKVPKYAHTIHEIANGAGALSFALPTREVYRGLSAMKLPKNFLISDKFGVKAGADYGFMSTTLNQEVALEYSTWADGQASTVIAIQMDEQNRGAPISVLSYYPHEQEILFPPLARLEVRGEPMLKSFRTKELQYFQMQIHVFQVGFARPCVPCVRSIVTSSNPIL